MAYPPPVVLGKRLIPGRILAGIEESGEIIKLLLRILDRLMPGRITVNNNKKYQNKSTHPTPRHLDHVVGLVNYWSEETDTVLDPFMGSGTTAVACKKLGRKFVGIEINEAYCAEAVKRLGQEELFNGEAA